MASDPMAPDNIKASITHICKGQSAQSPVAKLPEEFYETQAKGVLAMQELCSAD